MIRPSDSEVQALLELFERARFELVENYPKTEAERNIAFHKIREYTMRAEKVMSDAAPIFGKG